MLSNAYRFIFELQSFLKPSLKGAPCADIKEVANLLINRVNNNQSLKLYRNDNVVYRIRKAQINDRRYLVLLISCGDKNTSDPSFENFNTGQVRSAGRTNDEGQSYAAHMVIDLEPSPMGESINIATLERVPGLSPGVVKMFLRSEIKEVFEEKYTDESGKEKKYTATLELDGHASHTLQDALENGTLKDVSLVNHEKKQEGFDEADYTVEKEQQVTMKIESDTINAVDVFKNICNRFINSPGADDYDTMIVRIKTAQGGTKQASLDLGDDEDLLSRAFYHQEMIDGFRSPLESSSENIRDDVVIKMINLMQDNDAK